MTYLKLATTLAAAAFAGSAMIAVAGPEGDQFGAMDADGDGLVTEAEFVTYATATGKHSEADAKAKFAEISGDDGALTFAELEAARDAAKTAQERPAGS